MNKVVKILSIVLSPVLILSAEKEKRDGGQFRKVQATYALLEAQSYAAKGIVTSTLKNYKKKNLEKPAKVEGNLLLIIHTYSEFASESVYWMSLRNGLVRGGAFIPSNKNLPEWSAIDSNVKNTKDSLILLKNSAQTIKRDQPEMTHNLVKVFRNTDLYVGVGDVITKITIDDLGSIREKDFSKLEWQIAKSIKADNEKLNKIKHVMLELFKAEGIVPKNNP